MNPLLATQELGQSIWLDSIRRGLITSGELHQLVEKDGLRGVTSNPAIFEKAISGSPDYNNALKAVERRKDLDAKSLFEELAVKDIQDAADVLWPVYEKTAKRDGYVSLEVSPYLARDSQATVEEARRLWNAVGRDNVMIKVPATPEGIPAIVQIISEGINVNVTLLFARAMYERVSEAFMEGLEKRLAAGGEIGSVCSVASFFISRIDSAVDGQIEARLKGEIRAVDRSLLKSLLGKTAIANAKLTYQRYKEFVRSKRWQALAAKDAKTQRLLWASTGTKNPTYRDVLYIEELIGPDTVNTVPGATLDAYREHGRPRASLEEHLEEAHDSMEILEQVGISMDRVTDKLLDEAVTLFSDAFDKLLAAVEKKREIVLGPRLDRQTFTLPPDLDKAVKTTVEDWRKGGKIRRLWARDTGLWTRSDESNWMGWLGITDDQLAHLDPLKRLSDEVRTAGYLHALLLGMGGSSLGPEVLKKTFGRIAGFPELLVLDSTDPAQIASFEGRIDLSKTLFIVSSKSGSTLEPNIFKQYFFEKARKALGEKDAGRRFIAITDPGSKMQAVAEGDGFGHVFFGRASIGGRYSVLSDFGMVPAAIMGLDVSKVLDRAEEMVHSCASCVPPESNPGVALGIVLGEAVRQGKDKVTLIASPAVAALGAWLEQLLAESTGKSGKGLIPIDIEEPGPPSAYGQDRVFVHMRLDSAPDPKQDVAVDALEKAGHPVVRIHMADPYEIGQEFFRWEIATAVAGSILGIHPFNQPDVEASKIATRRLTSEYEKSGTLPGETPLFRSDGLALYADAMNAAALNRGVGKSRTLSVYLKSHLDRLGAGDYFALLAYVEMTEAHERTLHSIRHAVRDSKRVATCLGFGPRFLHSTGQAYKGGPNSGVFLQVTCDDAADLPVPGQNYTFGVVKAAQARGDFEVLAERERRALRVHLGKDVESGLALLGKVIREALR